MFGLCTSLANLQIDFFCGEFMGQHEPTSVPAILRPIIKLPQTLIQSLQIYCLIIRGNLKIHRQGQTDFTIDISSGRSGIGMLKAIA